MNFSVAQLKTFYAKSWISWKHFGLNYSFSCRVLFQILNPVRQIQSIRIISKIGSIVFSLYKSGGQNRFNQLWDKAKKFKSLIHNAVCSTIRSNLLVLQIEKQMFKTFVRFYESKRNKCSKLTKYWCQKKNWCTFDHYLRSWCMTSYHFGGWRLLFIVTIMNKWMGNVFNVFNVFILLPNYYPIPLFSLKKKKKKLIIINNVFSNLLIMRISF
jgi:hypothetical protein